MDDKRCFTERREIPAKRATSVLGDPPSAKFRLRVAPLLLTRRSTGISSSCDHRRECQNLRNEGGQNFSEPTTYLRLPTKTGLPFENRGGSKFQNLSFQYHPPNYKGPPVETEA